MASKNEEPKRIDLNDMTLSQINAFKQQLDNDIEILEQSIFDLHGARQRFLGCVGTCESFDSISNNSQIMVPLTSSLYVPGNVISNDEFLVDIGTGYYIEKDRKGTVDYFNRKSQFLNGQIDKFVKTMQEKSAIRQAIIQRQSVLVQAQLQASKT